MLQIGLASSDITPEPGLPTAGGPNPPEAEVVEFPLAAKAMAISDGSRSIALISLDLLFINRVTVDAISAAVSDQTELGEDDVLIACTHTHYAPYTTGIHDGEPNFAYLSFVQDQIVHAVRRALAQRSPARLRVAETVVPGWTFNRRPIMSSGEVATEGPASGPDFDRLEGQPDDDLQLLIAHSEDGDILGGLVNFACHPTVRDDGPPKYSADFPGALTARLAQQLGGIYLFGLGASGDLWAFDLSRSEPAYSDSMDHVNAMAETLSGGITEAHATADSLEVERIRLVRAVLQIKQRRPTWAQVELARWYLEKAPPDVDQSEFTRRIYGHDFTFHDNDAVEQEWFARETIGMWEWQRRVGTPELIEEVEVAVLELGDLAIATFPVELFSEFGRRVKGESPYRRTMVLSLTNGWHGYVPTLEAFSRGGYEPRLGLQSRLEKRAGEAMAETALRLLQELNEISRPARRPR